MKQETRQQCANGTVIAEGRPPANCQYEQRYQIGQKQGDEFKVLQLLWVQAAEEDEFPRFILGRQVGLKRVPESHRHLA